MAYLSRRFMKQITLLGSVLVAAVALSACDPKPKPRQKPAPSGDNPTEVKPQSPTTPTIDPDSVEPKEKTPDPDPIPKNKIPEPASQRNPEYAIKVEGKTGYVKSPYDNQGRLIDVRGLPPATEAECPYTHRTFLVPP